MGKSDPIPRTPRRPGARRRESGKLVYDTVAGPNLRFKDNLYQGIAVGLFALVGAIIGYAASKDPDRWLVAAVLGLLGLLLGFFVSGIFLMIYRPIRHLLGKRD